MPLRWGDFKTRVYPASCGLYVLSPFKIEEDGKKHGFKIGSGTKLIRRINNAYTLCYITTGFYLYCIIRLKQRTKSKIVKEENKLFKFLKSRGINKIKSSVRERPTEWVSAKRCDLQKAITEWCNLPSIKKNIIWINNQHNALETWKGIQFGAPIN